MKFEVNIKMVIDTDEYSDEIKDEEIKPLVESMISGNDDWPETVTIEIIKRLT